MRTISCALISVFLLSAGLAEAQEKNWKKSLESGLKELYPNTSRDNGFWSTRNAIKETGATLVLQQGGITAQDGTGLLLRVSEVRDGKLTKQESAHGPGFSILGVGDKVFVTDINVDSKKIDFHLMTADPIRETKDGNTREIRHVAVLRFQYDEGFLASATMTEVAKSIAPVLLTESQAAAVDTKTIELGQTLEQVESIFGKPLTVARLGDKVIYGYKDMKVIFVNGKVSDVQ